MFTGQAEEAMRCYVGLFPDAEITGIERHGPEDPAQAGKILRGSFRLGDQHYMCFDSPPVHDFTFTPATSTFVTCTSEAELMRLSEGLGEGGKVLMPVGNYGFSQMFTWLSDRFGVSWQLNLP